jgi:hypothetical protein
MDHLFGWASQWKCGRLLEQVKEKALHIIDSGADLKRWSGDSKRRAVLEKTRAQLLSPQPRPPRIRKRYQENNEWDAGELISYQTAQGKYAVLRILGHATGSTGKHPIVELVDWYAVTPASLDDARYLQTRFGIERPERCYGLSHAAILAARSSRDQPTARLSRLGLSAAPLQYLSPLALFWRLCRQGLCRAKTAAPRGWWRRAPELAARRHLLSPHGGGRMSAVRDDRSG